jgi:hypothetical protein
LPYGVRAGVGIFRPGLFSRDGPVLRGMPLDRRRPIYVGGGEQLNYLCGYKTG